MNEIVSHLLLEQLNCWETARNNYQALSDVQTRVLSVKTIPYRLQYNPARIVSSGAKVDTTTITQRPCFLCPSHRPIEQKGIEVLNHYELLVNPYPIFPKHFTVVEKEHMPQRILYRFTDLLELARILPDYTIFYNGPCCGASAPDHAHFQAGCRGFLPIEDYWKQWIDRKIVQMPNGTLYSLNDTPRTTLIIESTSSEVARDLFHTVYKALPLSTGEYEPRMNILSLYKDCHWEIFIFPRSKHRPACYNAPGRARLLSSPASVDLGGVFILPREEDFLKIKETDLIQILHEVCLPKETFKIN